ncbi:hypothetical protein SNEBB_009593 [Seison nebaliae]|nr:hypothetical protein SNEBB_009593 [Seison nebaliae]
MQSILSFILIISIIPIDRYYCNLFSSSSISNNGIYQLNSLHSRNNVLLQQSLKRRKILLPEEGAAQLFKEQILQNNNIKLLNEQQIYTLTIFDIFNHMHQDKQLWNQKEVVILRKIVQLQEFENFLIYQITSLPLNIQLFVDGERHVREVSDYAFSQKQLNHGKVYIQTVSHNQIKWRKLIYFKNATNNELSSSKIILYFLGKLQFKIKINIQQLIKSRTFQHLKRKWPISSLEKLQKLNFDFRLLILPTDLWAPTFFNSTYIKNHEIETAQCQVQLQLLDDNRLQQNSLTVGNYEEKELFSNFHFNISGCLESIYDLTTNLQQLYFIIKQVSLKFNFH